MKKLLLVLLCLLLLLPLASCGKDYTETTLKEMAQEWEKNQARANDKYKGAYVTICAAVSRVNDDSFTIKDGSYTAKCTLKSKRLKDDALALNKDGGVQIRGKIKSLGDGDFGPTIVVSEIEDIGPALKYQLNSEKTGYIVVGSFVDFDNEELIIPSTFRGLPVTEIGNGALQYCKFFKVTIPDSIKIIEPYAFYQTFLGCANLKSVTFENPNGWMYWNGAPYELSAAYLSIPAYAARYLTYDLYSYRWYRQ